MSRTIVRVLVELAISRTAYSGTASTFTETAVPATESSISTVDPHSVTTSVLTVSAKPGDETRMLYSPGRIANENSPPAFVAVEALTNRSADQTLTVAPPIGARF